MKGNIWEIFLISSCSVLKCKLHGPDTPANQIMLRNSCRWVEWILRVKGAKVKFKLDHPVVQSGNVSERMLVPGCFQDTSHPFLTEVTIQCSTSGLHWGGVYNSLFKDVLHSISMTEVNGHFHGTSDLVAGRAQHACLEWKQPFLAGKPTAALLQTCQLGRVSFQGARERKVCHLNESPPSPPLFPPHQQSPSHSELWF